MGALNPEITYSIDRDGSINSAKSAKRTGVVCTFKKIRKAINPYLL
jgi:hypothetical protein